MKLPLEEIQKIAIFRALQLGDLLCAIPAIRTLRHSYPHSRISLIGLPGMREIATRFPHYIDEFIDFPGYPGLPEQQFDAEKFALFREEMNERRFDLILQMQGNGSIVNAMLGSFGAKYLSGFCEHREKESPLMLCYPNYGHEVTRHLALMKHLECEDTENLEMEFPITEHDGYELEKRGPRLNSGEYVCIHPGSRGSWRQWPPLYFASVADICSAYGYKVVITGTAAEVELAEKIAGLMRHQPLVTSGKTNLGMVALLIKNAQALICNCTGVSHIAAALKTKSVVISMDGEPERWGPLDKSLHRTIDWTTTPDYKLVQNEVTALLSVKEMHHSG